MNIWIKLILILLGGFVFYLLTGDLSEAFLLIAILGYFESVINKK